MLSDERRRVILDLLNTKGSVTVAELGSRFDVSEMTIRRDLDDLERRGLLQRVHGGAVSARGRSFEPAFLSRSGLQLLRFLLPPGQDDIPRIRDNIEDECQNEGDFPHVKGVDQEDYGSRDSEIPE